MELTRLLYVSTAAFDTTPEDARAIAEQSAVSNVKAEITGAMASTSHRYWRALMAMCMSY